MAKTTRTPLYNQVKEYLLRFIAESFHEDNYSFPSEPALCSQFNVSRTTARRAIYDLTEEGFLIRRKGSGTTIKKTLDENQKSLLSAYLPENDSSPPSPLKPQKTVAVILPDLKSNYMTGILDGIQENATKNEWNVIIAISNYDQEHETNLIRRFLTYCQGLIIFPVNKETYNKEIIKLSLKNYPLVAIDNLLNGVEMSSITSDNKKTAYKAVKYFIQHGKKNIAIVSPPFDSAYCLMERYRGYREALSENNIPMDKNIILNNIGHYDEKAEILIHNLLYKNPKIDAVVSFNFEIGITALRVIKNTYKHLSTDDIIIFDDEFGDLFDLLQFKVKYIKQNALLIGQKAFQIIFEKTSNPDFLNRHLIIPETLVFK